MKIKTKKRIATAKEKNWLLDIEGYDKHMCAGKCIVHLFDPGECGMFLVNKMEHKCKYGGNGSKI